MKYKTFRALVLGGVVVLGGGGAIFAVTRSQARKLEPSRQAEAARALAARTPASPPATDPAPAPEPEAPTPVPPAEAGDLRPMDREILARARQGIGADKQKDAIPGKPYKVNLYKDAGKAGVNRLKVDLDRDEKWDEKWTLGDDGTVERQVSTADDDKTYDQEYLLRGERWTSAAAAPAPAPVPAPAASDAAAGPLRPMDQEILRLAASAATSDKMKDAFPSAAYKVNLYRDAGKPGWNRAKVDLDRDENDDEKWTFEGSGAALEVKRQVSPADDGQYPVEYRLRGGAWVEKK